MEKEEAKLAVSQLVEKWRKLEAEGKLRLLSEADTKSNFIEPLFEALGWSVRDLDEVSREEAVSRKRVDYAFKLSGVTRFFLEAKAASVPLEEKEAKQATDYSHYKSVPWAVLTNFKELVVYDCERESLSDQRFLSFSTDSYLSDFDRLWLLRKEGIASGELERFAQGVGRGKKREPLTKKLFADFRQWRGALSRNISEHSRLNKLESKELVDEGVQKLLNRFVFIRSCEDRGFENERLREAVRTWKSENKRKLLRYLMDVFDDFNEAYDSDLFSPHFASSLYIDDAVVEKVVEELYKYEFGIIDADVLGNVYEQYLATMMREGGGLRENESKRKEMGIYYTPTYIVDYIVKNTLGELVSKAKSPADLEKIKILDPACGSGSFLIRAYETLNSAYSKKNGGDSQLLLETVSKNAYTILTKNIYGVDLDQKAVEIAELNLLLRAARRRGMLPPLYENVKCGNSLISGTPEEMEQYFGKEWRKKKPFNWEEKFADVMTEGGFDVVVGNPPYGAEFSEEDKEYLKKKFVSAVGRFDSFHYFIERGVNLLDNGGVLGFIVPDTWLTNHQTLNLREFILSTCSIAKIVSLPQDVFPDANVDTCVIILRKEKNDEKRAKNNIYVKIMNKDAKLSSLPREIFEVEMNVEQKKWIEDKRKLFNIRRTGNTLVEKIEINCIRLEEITDMGRGINPYDKYAGQTKDVIENRVYHSEKKLGKEYKKEIVGSDIGRYKIEVKSKLWIKYGPWLAAPRNPKFFTLPHLVVQRIRNPKLKRRLVATFIDPSQEYYNNSGLTNIIIIQSNFSIKYLLALINSTLFNWYFSQHFRDVNIKPEDLRELPIRLASESDQQSIIKLVDRMLELNKRLVEIGDKQSSERHELEQEIRKTDEKIDELIYKLYGISDEERKVIEESLK